MANLQIKDGAASTKYVKTSGTGANDDPLVPEHLETNSASILTAIEALQTAIDGTIDVAAASLPLPTGAATAASQTTGNTLLAAIQSALGSALPLPTGAATAANQSTANTTLSTIAASVAAATPSGENHIGEVSANDTVIEVIPTLDTSAYASGDVLFAETDVTSAARSSGKAVTLISLCVVDKDDQKQPFDLYFFDRTVTFGTRNSAPSISDADAAYYMGHVAVAAADYKDLGGVSVASPRIDPKMIKPSATSIFIAAVTGGTPTHTASGLVIKLGLTRS